jgi:hypothetical protein
MKNRLARMAVTASLGVVAVAAALALPASAQASTVVTDTSDSNKSAHIEDWGGQINELR